MFLKGKVVQVGTEVNKELVPARLRREPFIEAVAKKKGPRTPQVPFER